MDFSNVKKITISAGEVKQIEIDGVVVWKGGYTNLVPTSIDKDGSVFNGTGYKDGYRNNSSGTLTASAGSTCSGLIKAKAGDIIRVAGVKWRRENEYSYFSVFDESFNKLGTVNSFNSTAPTHVTGVTNKANTTINGDVEGITTITTSADFSYFRISAGGNGADMIITVNEEIEE